MYGVRVVGTSDEIEKVIDNFRIEHVIIAIPSLDKKKALMTSLKNVLIRRLKLRYYQN